ncbi:MAG TPA: alanyl-tRNA editing protein [Candidatus Eisenbergiella stercorigallinarum]|uniref:Alanyl-tRNA editing protein n=1 Tax=Candidatus Eisenbergiella stercorigallinarum TaxID=2838557 RepID=A0A9D2R079_9FIRM|nr:alanyl-tRNA editing protein [Candidatus Eisenbergiella stercorigallinarum]
MTERLYYKDAYCREFDAQVRECREEKQGFAVILDRTAFYPEGGGQPADQGSLGEARVLDVQEEGQEVVHLCDRPFPAGSTVHGSLDWERRERFMQQHSGEHIFSGIVHRCFGYDNIGFHMGKDCVTVDFSGMLTEADIARVERLANRAVLDDLEILTSYPSAEELDTLDYRSKKELEGQVRIITVPGSDVCACCGTHVKRTGEIGPIKAVSSEHYKSGIRISLQIGWKALEDYEEKHKITKEISALLSVPPQETAEAVRKLLQQLQEQKAANVAMKQKQLDRIVQETPEGKERAVCFEEDLNPVEVRMLADRLSKKARFAAVFSGNEEEGYKYVICSAETDVAAFGKRFNEALNGRGGGRNPMIQGSVAAKRAQIEEFLLT